AAEETRGRGVVYNRQVMRWVELPSSLPALAMRPWTVVTYMFSQYDVLHILFNLLWFYWFGTLFRMVATPRQMLALYIYGGFGGALLFLAAYNLLPLFAYSTGWLIGSSASVIAIVTATAILMPDFRMNLLLIGPVSLKWIAIATIVLVLIGVTGNNAGGEIAHIGGVLVGVWFGVRMKRGHDITAPLNRFFDLCVNACRGLRRKSVPKASPRIEKDDREVLDEILDKIKRSGYAALTPEERKKLFDVSRRVK
ncbi:MAG: rhomboid family intramembrane serine protease, partial [Duncaniella sp.]|nr:rhomboid family intramembrane serine protease [Duncaniella sp.]